MAKGDDTKTESRLSKLANQLGLGKAFDYLANSPPVRLFRGTAKPPVVETPTPTPQSPPETPKP